jgi:hypothetical protein
VVVQGQADLLEIVGAAQACSGLAHFLHGRQEQADEHGDDGDHHQQLDQGKRTTGTGCGRTVQENLLLE